MKTITEKQFQKLIKLAAQPVQEAEKRSVQKKSGDYSGKKTRQRKAVNTSG